ncbi:MAG: hypothetical protein ACR2GH_07190 [Pseudonocardia sp.]
MTSMQQTPCRDTDRAVTGGHPIVPGEVVTGRINGCEVRVHLDYRRWVTDPSSGPGFEPVAVEVTAPMRLSLDDVTAVLFAGLEYGEDLEDPAAVRELVADLVVSFGASRIEDVRLAADAAVRRGDAWPAYCRRLAAAVFGVPDPRRSGEVA